MENRAVITDRKKQVGIYLHWNGGRDSVEAFLEYCKLRQFRFDDYGRARFCQIVGNFFGGGLSIGIDLYKNCDCDNGDNGVYVVDNWEIVERLYSHGEQMSYDRREMLREIDQAQPERDRLGGYLDAIEVPRKELEIGDMVWVQDYEGPWKAYPVVGFGQPDGNRIAVWVDLPDGRRDVFYPDLPYVKRIDHDGDYSWNCNNYIREETCWITPKEG